MRQDAPSRSRSDNDTNPESLENKIENKTRSKVYDEFAARVAALVRSLRVGDGAAPGTTHGPLINAAALAKVEAHCADAVAKGARVLAGGARPAVANGNGGGGSGGGGNSSGGNSGSGGSGEGTGASAPPPLPEANAGGHFFAPTVLADATIDM